MTAQVQPMTTRMSSQPRLVRLAVLLLVGAIASGVLAPAVPAAEPAPTTRSAAAQDDSGDLSPFAVAAIAFGLAMAERLAEDAASGRVDLADLGRRARKLLESSSRPGEPSQLF